MISMSMTAASNEGYAGLLFDLSSRLSYMDRREDALKAIEEAVQLYRQLAADRPAAFTPNLATSLINLSNCLSDLGRREDALTAIEEQSSYGDSLLLTVLLLLLLISQRP